MLYLKKIICYVSFIFIALLIFYHIDMTEEPVKLEVEEIESTLISLGEFRLTAYCSCAKCCGEWALNRPDGIVYGASGSELKANYSIAVDTSIIPYGTEVIIDDKQYSADD